MSRRWCVLVAASALVLSTSCNASSEPTGPTTSRPAPTTASPPTVPADAVLQGPTPCPAADGSSRRVILFAEPPPRCIDPARRYAAKVRTSVGEFTIALDASRAPNSVNNFVVLSRYHYFDGLPFDQNAPGEYIGTGVHPPPAHGDPGYRLPSELPPDPAEYAKAGTVIIDTENAGTDGSLWIVLLTDRGVAPRFTIVGQVSAGLDVAAQVGNWGSAPATTAAATVTNVTISELG